MNQAPPPPVDHWEPPAYRPRRRSRRPNSQLPSVVIGIVCTVGLVFLAAVGFEEYKRARYRADAEKAVKAVESAFGKMNADLDAALDDL